MDAVCTYVALCFVKSRGYTVSGTQVSANCSPHTTCLSTRSGFYLRSVFGLPGSRALSAGQPLSVPWAFSPCSGICYFPQPCTFLQPRDPGSRAERTVTPAQEKGTHLEGVLHSGQKPASRDDRAPGRV